MESENHEQVYVYTDPQWNGANGVSENSKGPWKNFSESLEPFWVQARRLLRSAESYLAIGGEVIGKQLHTEAQIFTEIVSIKLVAGLAFFLAGGLVLWGVISLLQILLPGVSVIWFLFGGAFLAMTGGWLLLQLARSKAKEQAVRIDELIQSLKRG